MRPASLSKLSDTLREQGYRLTLQREIIIEAVEAVQGHISVDDIYQQVHPRFPQVNLSTIYRTLELLRELGLVRENHLPGEQPRYEAAAGKAHHHLVCRLCRRVIHLDDTLLGNLNEQLQEQYHFHGLTLDLVAAGYCDTCWDSMQHEVAEKHD